MWQKYFGCKNGGSRRHYLLTLLDAKLAEGRVHHNNGKKENSFCEKGLKIGTCCLEAECNKNNWAQCLIGTIGSIWALPEFLHDKLTPNRTVAFSLPLQTEWLFCPVESAKLLQEMLWEDQFCSNWLFSESQQNGKIKNSKKSQDILIEKHRLGQRAEKPCEQNLVI